MDTAKLKPHPGWDGIERYWVWVHRQPLAIEGRKRDKYPSWHAFKNRDEAKAFAERTDAYAKLSDEVGYGTPPQTVILDSNYAEHFEPWE